MIKLTILFLIFSFTFCKAQEIIIEPIGISDKPLPRIKISEVCKENKFDCYKLPRGNINKYIKIELINFNKIHEIDSLENEYPYGAYRVLIIIRKDKYTLILKDRVESFNYFSDKLQFFEQNKKLYLRLQSIIKRLR